MRATAFFSSAVVGLAAVAVAMPMINGRGIVTIGTGGDSSQDSPDEVSTTTSSAPTSTPTFDPSQPQGHNMKLVADDGMWNKTKYDDSDKFNDGLWHPNGTTTTGATLTATPTGISSALLGFITPTTTPTGLMTGTSTDTAVALPTSTDAAEEGTQVSGGLSLTEEQQNGDHKKHQCIFGFCF